MVFCFCKNNKFYLFFPGLSWFKLKEWSRTLPSTGQSCSGRATFDILQPCGLGKWFILPQHAKSHSFGTGGTENLGWASQQLRWNAHWHSCPWRENIYFLVNLEHHERTPWMYQSRYQPRIISRICSRVWLETQPHLTYEYVQNHKLFVLCFAKVEPLVKQRDCIYYTYCHIFFLTYLFV